VTPLWNVLLPVLIGGAIGIVGSFVGSFFNSRRMRRRKNATLPRRPCRTCGPRYQRLRRGRPQHRRASRCGHFSPRNPQQLPRCRKPLHLLCLSNLNHNRKPRLSRRPNRCRGRRCPCARSGFRHLSDLVPCPFFGRCWGVNRTYRRQPISVAINLSETLALAQESFACAPPIG
jgi:uncharacterized membrane protein YccC